MAEKKRPDLNMWLRNLRLIALVPLGWIILCVIIPDFVFTVIDYKNSPLMVLRHGMAMILMALAVIYLLLQIKSQRGVTLPLILGLISLVVSQPFRIIRDAHLLDEYLDPFQYTLIASTDKALTAFGLTMVAWAFLFGIIELLGIRQRLKKEHEGMLAEMVKRRRAEEERILLSTAIEQGAESVMIADKAGVIQYVNPAFERLTGYARDEVVGKSARVLRSGKHEPFFYANLWRTISRGDTWHGHFINRRKDGSLFEEDAAISCVRNDAGEIMNYVAIKHDVTNETNLERQLRQVQRMESMGALAGHIAHDFNNILALILGHCEIAERHLSDDDPIRFSMQHIAKAGNRAKDLVRQILTFSRQLEHERKPVQIHGVVNEALDFLRVSLPSTIELHSNIRQDCGYVLADPTSIHQIVMNLCTNAFQAMNKQPDPVPELNMGAKPSIGVLEVKLGLERVPANFIADVGVPAEGTYVCLTVRDSGHGMDPAITQRIFDPFFTTKKPGEGTGLGLSVVHGIVLSYGGAISVYSEPGVGTVFKVFFPRIENGVADFDSADGPAPRGSERILLVDDDPDIVRMIKMSLEQLGYHVEAFLNSAQALDAFRARPNDFSVVITDQVMPDMTGLDLTQKLLEVRPGLPIIVLTGFGMGVTPAQTKLAGVAEYLMKPATSAVLSSAIRRCLDRQA